MKNLKFYLPLFFALLLMSCKTNGSSSKSETLPVSEKYPPVETGKANTDYQPAFQGQTRSPGVRTTTPYDVKIIAEGLARPWGITPMPDGRILITEKGGTLRIATSDGQLSAKITGTPANLNSGGQGGLQGLTLAPDFKTSRQLYFMFSEKGEQGNVAAVAKANLSADETRLENVQVIYRALPYWEKEMHYGGRIIFDGKGNLFVITGERSVLPARYKAQTLDNAFGKVVHITTDGKPVEGGPFADTAGAFPEIYSYGHRNPLGIDLHPATGDLWVVEMGPRGGGELNLIKPGKNYGWPTVTYGIEYNGNTIGEGITIKEGTEQPVYYWDPVISPGGMTFYDSNVIPEWKNNLFIAGLSSKHIIRLVIRENKIAGEERLLADQGQRIRDVTETNGALYAITDEGRLYRITKK